MALYVYSRYTRKSSGGGYYVSWGPSTSYPIDSDDWYSGGTSYSTSGGSITISGSRIVRPSNPGTVYTGGGSSITRYSVSGNRLEWADGTLEYNDPYYTRGTFVDYVIAEDGTYPNDDYSGSYWYVKGPLAQIPTNLVPNGGESWSGNQTVTWNSPGTNLNYKIELSLNNGQSWSVIGNTTNNSLAFDFSTVSESSLAKIKVSAFSGESFVGSKESSGVFTIIHNVAPTTPTNLSPSGRVIDRTIAQRFSWRHNDNDAQSQAEIRWRPQGTSIWANVNLLGAGQEYFFSPNTLPAGNIEWQVRTYDQQSLISPWSSTAVFTAAEPSNAPEIVSPSDIVSVARPVIQWTSGAQTVYQIIIENSTGDVVWDTGSVLSSVKSRTAGIDFVNGARYKIKIRIQDGSGLYSSFTEKTVQVSYTPPAKPFVEVMQTDGGIRFVITNPPPVDTQPTVERMSLYKRIEGELTLIEDIITTTYTDFATVSEAEEQYMIRVYGDNGTYTNSDVVTATAPKLNGLWLHDVDDPELTIRQFLYIDGDSQSDSYRKEHAYRKYAGRKRPVIEYGVYEDYGVKLNIQLDDKLGRERLIHFSRTGAVLLYRDYTGRKFYTTLPELDFEQVFYGHSIDVEFVEIDYDEGV